ncbi:MAG: serine/threonine protein kinase [Planctomycetes bacterium]|nr:serine/threonine protein kinase [Planctomycetota bacterium]
MSGVRFDDLLAGRILARERPDLRARALAHLDALTRGEAARSLLGTLVAEGRLPLDAARGVQERVDRYRAGRGIGVLAELLGRAGVAPERVQEEGRRLGPSVDLERLGRALVAARLLAPAQEERLRLQARVALDRDLAAEVARFVEGRQALAPAGTVVLRGEVAVPSAAEARAIVDRAIVDRAIVDRAIVDRAIVDRAAPPALPAPRFAIPPWVDVGEARVGARVADRYRVVGRIGAGGHGLVLLAFDEAAPERPLALKLLPRGARAQAVGRFKREALANSLFHHPGALEVVDAGETRDGEHYLVVEFFDGQDLARALELRRRLRPAEALRVARRVLEVLDAAHAQGVIHRDVKPENVLVSRDLERVKLMDFGIALLRDLGEFDDRVFHTVGPDVVGTPRYMSPEQAASEALGPTSDLYALGLVLYELLTGAFPYESDSPLGYLACHITEDPRPLAAACPEAARWPAALHDLVTRLLQKDPDDRPQTAAEAIAAVDRALALLG